jgi:hypothetical protein
MNRDEGIKVRALRDAHKHYKYKAHTYALKIMGEQDGKTETCFNILTDKLFTWNSYQ